MSPLNTTLWPLLFNDNQQRRILAAAAPVERMCVAWSPRRMAVLMNTSDVASRPLVAWLEHEFEPRARFDDWELRVRRGRPPADVYIGRWGDEGSIVLDLPSMGHEAAQRIAVLDTDSERILADSARGGEIVALDEAGARLSFDAGINVTQRRRITLRPAATSLFPSGDRPVVVRMWARTDQSLATVPVVTRALDDVVPVTGR